MANSQDGTVTRIDPATGQPGGPVSVGSGPAGIAITPGAVWVANSLDLTVSKIDPATDRVTAIIDVGDGPSAIVAAKNAIWVSDEFDATLDRIDPRAGEVTGSVFVGSSPQGLVATPSGMWVAARAFTAASHRGGTLTVVERRPACDRPVTQDLAHRLPRARHGVRRPGHPAPLGGAPGLTLVPDLAMRLPRPAERRHNVHVHAPPRHPLLERHAGAGVRLPSRFRTAARLGRRSRLLRRHPRRANVPPAPAAMRPVRRDHHQQRDPDGNLPPRSRRPRLLLQTRAAPRRPGPTRRPGPRHPPRAVPARHRPSRSRNTGRVYSSPWRGTRTSGNGHTPPSPPATRLSSTTTK